MVAYAFLPTTKLIKIFNKLVATKYNFVCGNQILGYSKLNLREYAKILVFLTKGLCLTSIFADFFKLRHPRSIIAMVVPNRKNTDEMVIKTILRRFMYINLELSITNLVTISVAFARYRIETFDSKLKIKSKN